MMGDIMLKVALGSPKVRSEDIVPGYARLYDTPSSRN